MVLSGLAVWALPQSAQAQQQPGCFPLDELLAALKRIYREEPVIAGVSASNAGLMLLASPSGTFSAVMVQGPIGCLVLSGTGWTGPKPGTPS